MASRVFQHGYYAPMESLSLDIRRYVGERLGVSKKRKGKGEKGKGKRTRRARKTSQGRKA
jgi:hypothetical protein